MSDQSGEHVHWATDGAAGGWCSLMEFEPDGWHTLTREPVSPSYLMIQSDPPMASTSTFTLCGEISK